MSVPVGRRQENKFEVILEAQAVKLLAKMDKYQKEVLRYEMRKNYNQR